MTGAEGMGEYLEFSTEDGSLVPVDFAADDEGQQLVSGADGAVRASRTFEDSLSGVRSAAESALRVFRDGSLRPDSVEIEFGVKLTAEAGALIAKSAMEGHLVVKLTWSPGQQSQFTVVGQPVAAADSIEGAAIVTPPQPPGPPAHTPPAPPAPPAPRA
ncbi:CU044_2847 family protein [Streptomyces sp. NPDC050418]|uniref:CU044_2847 family protein n=1 Tax=Streptomyces sp. NPDC050418 TaxID=3365612 RepID=UPI003797AA68